MVPFRSWVLPGPEVLVARAHGEFDAEGHLTSESYITLLAELMAALKKAAS